MAGILPQLAVPANNQTRFAAQAKMGTTWRAAAMDVMMPP
jgi:hypothetical protein